MWLCTVIPQITTDTSGPDTSTAGSPSKPTLRPPTRASIAHNPTALGTPDPTPVPRASLERVQECTRCSGTGRVLCDDDGSDSSRADAKSVIFKRTTGSPTLERRPKRLSGGKRYEARDARTRCMPTKERAGPVMPSMYDLIP
ncbi:hypothetical protein FRC12_009697 [Ceratobasidium sp. 428]|nr:hypothetical protein FRC12_009697 [Ceratobasidium sp. 428]